jgi:hypothetical protein
MPRRSTHVNGRLSMETARAMGSTTRAVSFAPTLVCIDPALVFSSGFLATLVISTVMLLLLWFGVAQVDLPLRAEIFRE